MFIFAYQLTTNMKAATLINRLSKVERLRNLMAKEGNIFKVQQATHIIKQLSNQLAYYQIKDLHKYN